MISKSFRAAAAAAALSCAVALSTLTAFAATGQVNGTGTNVRSEASTSGSIVTTLDPGTDFEVGDATQDSNGMDWYAITTADGKTGYIRADLMTITEEDAEEASSDEDAEDASSDEEEAEEAASDEEAADAAASDTGDYQIVYAPDENGEDTYYLYDNAKSERIKISDIEALQSQVATAQQEAKNAGSKYKIIMIVLVVLLIAAIAAAVVLLFRLRDALTNGARERDLTRERRNARKRGDGSDGLSTLHRTAGKSSRQDAYVSGSRRAAAEQRTADGRSDARRRSGAAAQGSVRRSGAVDQRRAMSRQDAATGEGTRVRSQQMAEDGVRTDPIRRSQTPQQSAVRQARPQAQQSAVRQARPQAAPQAQRTQAPVQQAPKAQPRNFAEDDDFDYDFLNKD